MTKLGKGYRKIRRDGPFNNQPTTKGHKSAN